MKSILIFLLLGHWALGQEPARCVGYLCLGQPAYGRLEDGSLYFGVLRRLPDEKNPNTVRLNGRAFPVAAVAPISVPGCQGICPGDRVRKGGEESLVMAVFPGEELLLASPGQPLRRVPQDGYQKVEAEVDPREVAEGLRGMVALNSFFRGANFTPCEPSVISAVGTLRPPPQARDCQERFEAPSVADSVNKAYFEGLLKRGMSAPLSDFLKLWYPGEAPSDHSYLDCTGGRGSRVYREVTAQGTVPENCRPDTLYSWGPRQKLNEIAQRFSNGSQWRGAINPNSRSAMLGLVFSSVSAASTYGYGTHLIRFRVRPNVPMVFGNFGAAVAGVGVRDDRYQDFTIANGEALESFSYGTAEIYDEVVRDVLRFQQNTHRHLTYVAPFNNDYFPPGGLDLLYSQQVDGHEQTENSLKRNLLELIRQILAGEGRVHFAQGVCQNREFHYASERPNYLNPRER